MKKKFFAIILAFSFIICLTPFNNRVSAYSPPVVFGAPRNVGVMFDAPDLTNEPETWNFRIGYSASNEIKSIISADENRTFQSSGYDNLYVTIQVDYKINSGAWRTSRPNYMDWAAINYPYFEADTGKWTGNLAFDPVDLFSDLPTKTFTNGKAYFDTNSISFRLRFWVDYWKTSSDTHMSYFSQWSPVVEYKNSMNIYDVASMINYEPKVNAVVLRKNTDGKTYIDFGTDKISDNLELLNNISNSSLMTNVWLMVDGGSWVDLGKFKYLKSKFTVDVSPYFALPQLTGDEKYQVKMRYAFGYLNYPLAAKTGFAYSPFSSIISNGIPIYKGASSWAINDLNIAQSYGLITNRIIGNMVKNATREEFAELMVKLYEKCKGETIQIGTIKFSDTTNNEIIKAATVGLMNGTGSGKFTPKANITREQMAVTVFRTLKILAPNGNYSITGVKKFADDASISKWAKTGVYFCSKAKIVNGIGKNKFNPKGSATREMSVIVSKRGYEYNLNHPETPKPETPAPSPTPTATPAPTSTPA